MAKKVLITGCSDGGLGAALALAFHKAGWKVYASARNTKKLTQVAAAGIETVELDVQSEPSLKACVEHMTSLGHLDMLINNAGAGGGANPISDIDIPSARSLFELNVWSVISTIQAFLPLLLTNPSGAHIVNHTSTAAMVPGPFSSTYNASKAAISSYTGSLRLELSPFNIRVSELRTGMVRSNFFTNVNLTPPKIPEDSIYGVAREEINSLLGGDFIDNPTDADVWAKGVTGDLTKANPPAVIYRGKKATLVSYLPFLPQSYVDSQIKEMFKVNLVREKIEQAKKKA